MDPNAMTKSQLKSALVGHNVSIPAAARKSVFVGLYADHVLFRNCNCRSATIRVRNGSKSQLASSGFSSGDDDNDNCTQPEQPKGKQRFFGWLTGIFAGKGHAGTQQNVVQTLPSPNPCNYDGMLSQKTTKRGQQRLNNPSSTKRGQQLGSPNNKNRGLQQLGRPNNSSRQQPRPRVTVQVKNKAYATRPPGKKPCVAWSGPIQPHTNYSSSVANIFHRLSSTYVGNECLGGGKRYPSTSPGMLSRRDVKPNYISPCCRRQSKEDMQPAWTPCMLPTSEELNERIREQQKCGFYSQDKPGQKMASQPFTQLQIEVMSNAELLETLRQHGINCGPIVPSTRRVYQKKLLNLLSGGQEKWTRQEKDEYSRTYDDDTSDSSVEDDDDDDEMTPAELNLVQTRRGKAVAPERVVASGGLPKSPRRRIVPDVGLRRSEEESVRRERRRSSGAETLEHERQLKKERRVPLYLQILIFIFVSIIIYLIIYNLEPVFKHPISRTN